MASQPHTKDEKHILDGMKKILTLSRLARRRQA
jgi:hypothetical protein